MDPILLEPPIGGFNEQVSEANLDSPFCKNAFNFNIDKRGLVLRKGDAKINYINNKSNERGTAPYGTSNIFSATLNNSTSKIEFLDLEAGTVAYTTAAAAGDATFYPLFFNGVLFFFTDGITYLPGFQYNGTAWAAIGYTGPAGFAPRGGNVYNNRAYLIDGGAAPAFYYTGLNAIAGACTKVDLSSLVSEAGQLSTIAWFTLSDNTDTEIIQSFITINGEILFYSGSYPDSTSWRSRGRAKIGQPVGYGAYVQYQGDALVMTDNGVVSLRELFLKGSEGALNLSVNNRIQDTWQALVRAGRAQSGNDIGSITLNGFVRAAWDQKNCRIIFSFPFRYATATTTTAGSFYFVFHTLFGAWTTHRSYGVDGKVKPIRNMCFYGNKIVLVADWGVTNAGGLMVYEKEGATDFQDVKIDDSGSISYDYTILSAPVKQGRAYVSQGQGLDLIMKSDLYDTTNYTMISDLGVTTTANQLIPDQGTSLAKPMVNIGIEGTYIQYQIAGTTAASKSVGYELYGVNFWIERGDSPR